MFIYNNSPEVTSNVNNKKLSDKKSKQTAIRKKSIKQKKKKLSKSNQNFLKSIGFKLKKT